MSRGEISQSLFCPPPISPRRLLVANLSQPEGQEPAPALSNTGENGAEQTKCQTGAGHAHKLGRFLSEEMFII